MKKLIVLLLMLAPPVEACQDPAFSLLNELVGEWHVVRVEDGNERTLGEMSVREGAGGCALVEEWVASNGSRASALHWSEIPPDEDESDDIVPTAVLKQVYVDSSGWVMQATGEVTDGILVWSGETELAGEEVTLRNTVHGLGSDTIVHIGDISKDGGATWQRISSLRYERKPR